MTVFSTVDLRVIATLPTPGGENPDFIAYDAATQLVLAFNGKTRNATGPSRPGRWPTATSPRRSPPSARITGSSPGAATERWPSSTAATVAWLPVRGSARASKPACTTPVISVVGGARRTRDTRVQLPACD
ncbi:MAG: hypothetical protein KGN16_04955 [Burkholderiales bacterium]|nr:hypothetical protein [Burkholderiales bacterium]